MHGFTLNGAAGRVSDCSGHAAIVGTTAMHGARVSWLHGSAHIMMHALIDIESIDIDFPIHDRHATEGHCRRPLMFVSHESVPRSLPVDLPVASIAVDRASHLAPPERDRGPDRTATACLPGRTEVGLVQLGAKAQRS